MPTGTSERPPRRWTWGAPALLACSLAVAFLGGQAVRPLGAQSPKGTARATSYSYRQSNVYWNRVAVTINEWGDKGWEFVQVVPVINSNPGAGGEMQVVIVFRRPAG